MKRKSIDKLNKLKVTGEILTDFVQYLPLSAHVKDIKTGKYLLSNKTNSRIYGIEDEEEIIGLTVYDLDKRMQSKWGKEYAQTIYKLDREVSKKNYVVKDEGRVICDSKGLLRLQTMIKIPVRGINNKIKCIFTFSQNLTGCIDHWELFQLYLNKYQKKRDAIKLFLTHLQVDHYFHFNERKDCPSEKQVLVMLALAEQNNYKTVAKLLNVTYKTVESHIFQLKDKIVFGNLDKVIIQIRKKNW